jgi:F0F1-type ATP synthase membrane subunit c/vacuolar-type H+-ATPase subunit K
MTCLVNKSINKLFFFFTFFCIFISLPKNSYAQTIVPQDAFANQATTSASFGIANIVDIKNADSYKDGTIISRLKDGPGPSNTPYDSQVLGIVSRDAAIVFNSTGSSNGLPLISSGKIYVLVSTLAGDIKKGDLLTTSTIPGVAIKAIRDGYVLGSALEDYTNSNSNQTETIAVDLELHYFNAKSTLVGTLTDILKLAVLPTKDGPNPIFKYIVAALVVLGSFVLGFLSFGRTAAKGVEALGRNPAASKIIQLGIAFNVIIVIAIVIAGLSVAFLILRL